jgi:dihydroxy-acid dehydratase
MGTASTMSCVVEALGMVLPGTATIPAVDARRLHAAEAAGRRAVEMASTGPRPAEVLTESAFDNAITVLMALGGSTNAVVHLLALARRVGIELPLDRFGEISSRTPLLANIRPSGEHLFESLDRAGGVPALLKELTPLLDLDALTVSGATHAEQIAAAANRDEDILRPYDRPLSRDGGIAVLRGTLAPEGAIIKRSAASPSLFRHRGPAVVFEDIYDVAARIDDPSLHVDAHSVLVLRNTGPKGGPGMPEWGQLPIPERLLRQGVDDIVRVSDARMSGTAFGTVVLHVSPESAVGGPLLAVQDGDPIVLDVDAGRLDLDLDQREIDRRLTEKARPAPRFTRGYGAIFLEHVLQAHEGCDFDLLRSDGSETGGPPFGILRGWIGGW